MTEKQLQKAVCKYIKLQYPSIIFLSDMSGLRVSIGQAKAMKNLKSIRGIPDLIILEPNKFNNALCIELKISNPFKKTGDLKKDKHLQEQYEILASLCKKGYHAVFCVGFDEAKKTIDNYMNNR